MTSHTIGVIGLGSIGMRHCQNLIKLGHAPVTFDPDKDRTFAANCGNWTLDQVYRKSEAIIIASPSAEHASQFERAVKEGKHVFVEKPLSLSASVSSLQKTLKEAEKKKLVVMTGFNQRFNAAAQMAKNWIREGLIGDIQWASLWIAQKNDKPAYLRDGVIFNWASHEIDLALYLLGPAKVLSCAAHWTEGNDDMATIAMQHMNGCFSTIYADYLTTPEYRLTFIVGTEGRIQINLPSHFAGISSKKANINFTGLERYDDDYMAEMSAFISRIEGNSALGATGQDGLAAYIIASEARKMAEKK